MNSFLDDFEQFTLEFGIFVFITISILFIVFLVVLLILMSSNRFRKKVTNVEIKDKKSKIKKDYDDKLRYCKKCGIQLDNEGNYCKYCGKKNKRK